MYLCLDLAIRYTGWALFSEKGQLLDLQNLKLSPKLKVRDKSEQIRDITRRVYDLTQKNPFKGKDTSTVVIEDVYHNRNFKHEKWMLRLSGAIIEAFDTEVKFYQASQARRLVGIKGTSHKAEIQVWVLENLNKYSQKITKYIKRIDELKKLKDTEYYNKAIEKVRESSRPQIKQKVVRRKARQKARRKYKYQMTKLSQLIEKETGYSEHICDAIVLGKAYHVDSN